MSDVPHVRPPSHAGEAVCYDGRAARRGVRLGGGSRDMDRGPQGMERNEQIIARARQAGATMACTLMHIPEEEGVDYERDARHLLGLLRDAGISLIVDVGPETYEKLGCSRIEEFADLGITHVRLDYGFSPDETVRLSETFHIVCNASTVTKAEIAAWRAAGADFSRFAACHNYYPKQHTGLALEDVRAMNDRLSAYGFARALRRVVRQVGRGELARLLHPQPTTQVRAGREKGQSPARLRDAQAALAELPEYPLALLLPVHRTPSWTALGPRFCPRSLLLKTT